MKSFPKIFQKIVAVPAVFFALSGTIFAEKNDVPERQEFFLELPPVALTGTPQPIVVPASKLDSSAPEKKISLPKNAKNLALGKRVSASDENPIVGELAFLTDGDKDGDEGYEVELAPGTQWIQVDLEEKSEIFAIALWHFHRQKRAYFGVVIQISDDPEFKKNVATVFNNDFENSTNLGAGNDKIYVETNAGKIFKMPAGTRGRFVRFYSNGNTSDRGNHYIEAEIYGVPEAKK